jgi:cobalt-precorrin-5B (C1)-methyltransferase
MTKLGQGLLDLHSGRGAVDISWLAAHGAETRENAIFHARVKEAHSAAEVLQTAKELGVDIAAPVARAAWETAAQVLRGSGIALEIAVFDRSGQVLARTPFLPVH